MVILRVKPRLAPQPAQARAELAAENDYREGNVKKECQAVPLSWGEGPVRPVTLRVRYFYRIALFLTFRRLETLKTSRLLNCTEMIISRKRKKTTEKTEITEINFLLYINQLLRLFLLAVLIQ